MKQAKIWIEDLEEAKRLRKKPIIKTQKPPDFHYFVMPKDLKVQNRLADEMIHWIETNETIIDLDLFPLYKHLSPYRFYKAARENPYLDEALEVCRYIIGSRLKNGWAHRKLDGKFCQEILPQYNEAYRDWIRMKIFAAMEARQKSEASNFNVVLEPIPSSNLVPERIDENNHRDPDTTE